MNDNLSQRCTDLRHAIMSKEMDADVGWDLRDELLELCAIVAALAAAQEPAAS
jgi:hypothetical protein